MNPRFARLLKSSIFIVVLIAGNFFSSAIAQNSSLRSRIAVTTDGSKTKIWISDFPKNTNVVITDSENNLLSLISTNNYGTAYLILPVSIKTDIIVKTINGEIAVSNSVVEKDKKAAETIVSSQDANNSVKA